MLNVGYLTSDTSADGDEIYTPFYAIEPLLDYLPKDKIIWCPFDEDWSAFVQLLREKGFTVVNSHINTGQDFFTYEPEKWDLIVSNPPYSKKDKIIERCYSFNKPFALLLPIQSLQSKERFAFWCKGCELLCFDERVGFHTKYNYETFTKGTPFASAYFCKDILPEKLMFRKLNKYSRKLKDY